MPTVESIHLYVNNRKPQAKVVRDVLTQLAADYSLKMVDAASADVILALGGDGTMLRAVHEFPGVPVLGFNLGGLGYLASVGENDFSRAVAMLARGEFRVAERSMLEVRKMHSSAGGGCRRQITALNDVVVMREMSGHAAMLDLSVDGKCPTRYLADGIVVATPTGSTAYSLSAGGPVLMPDSGSIVITPMNPHALGVRPLVVGDNAVLSVSQQHRADGNGCKIGVYADGENVFMLEDGEVLEIAKSSRGAAMVELDGYDPYEVLAHKLGWSGSCVQGSASVKERR